MIISLLIPILAFAADPAKLNKVYEAKLPWKGNYSVRLEIPPDWYRDSGDFSRLSITRKGKEDFVIGQKELLQGQAMREVRILPKGVKKLGKFLQLIPSAPKGGVQLLGFDHWQGASNNNIFYLVAPGADGPYVAFETAVQQAEIRDYDGDGKYDILNKGGMGEPTGEYTFYDPYLVFRQAEKDGVISFKKDEELSKKYSLENKYEWHGPTYSSDIRVDKFGKEAAK